MCENGFESSSHTNRHQKLSNYYGIVIVIVLVSPILRVVCAE